MLKRILFALLIPASLLGGCAIEHRRPAVVQPRYVARCPAGYRYDGNDCHRIYAEHREPAVYIAPR